MFTKLSFSLEGGDALILSGPNGSGKSTLLRLLAGLLQPIKGEIHWSDIGSCIGQNPLVHYCRTHYVGHTDAIKSVMTVWENIAFWSQLRTPEPDIMNALTQFGLERLANVQGQFLSAGQKQCVNLARILATPADLWLLDEPATSLDSGAVSLLRKVISKHRGKGGIIIASTHQDLNLPASQTLKLSEFTAEVPVCV